MRSLSRSRLAPVAGSVLLLLAACKIKPHQVVADPEVDDQKQALANAAPVELPPSIQASKSYRCKDNSVVYIDWMSGGKQAAIHTKKDGTPTSVKADEAGKEMTGEGGYALSGSADAKSVDVTVPGKDKQTCDS